MPCTATGICVTLCAGRLPAVPSTVQVTVRLRPEQHRQLKEAAFHRDCDMSELVRQALDQFFA